MKIQPDLDNLISERWPKLKMRAQREGNPERLIALLEEIDDLLFNVEMRIAAAYGQKHSKDAADTRSVRVKSVVSLSGDAEVERGRAA